MQVRSGHPSPITILKRFILIEVTVELRAMKRMCDNFLRQLTLQFATGQYIVRKVR